jgi:hypothetical protein
MTGGLAAWGEASLGDGSGAWSGAEADAQLVLAAVFPENGYGTQLFEYYTSIPDQAGRRRRP